MKIAIFILLIALVIALVKAISYRKAVEALVIFIGKKGYTPPTQKELRECIKESLKKN